MTDLYRHYREQLRSVNRTDADNIIASAYNDYLKDRITYQEYGKIYFAALDIINGCVRKVVNE